MTEIKTLDPRNQDEVDDWHATAQACLDTDLCGYPRHNLAVFTVQLARRGQAHRKHRIVAKVDGRVVGYVSLDLPLKENSHLVEIELDVHPQYRRRGIGGMLLAETEHFARTEGRDTIFTCVADTIEGKTPVVEAGQHFARRHGFAIKSQEIRSDADLTAIDQSALDEPLAAAWSKAEDYELVQWAGSAPDDVVSSLAYLDSRLMADAPMGDLNIEPQNVDVARIREGESEAAAAGQTFVSTVVRHRKSGTVAGWTSMVLLPADEERCWQGITIVDPDHRGRRLGTILKIENHRQLLRYRPLMQYVSTYNAEVNDHMININEAIGFRAKERWFAFEKSLR